MLTLRARLETHYGHMKNFLRTEAGPSLQWLPAKHNKSTEKALHNAKALINQKIASLAEALPLPSQQPGAADDDSDDEDHSSDDDEDEVQLFVSVNIQKIYR